MTRTATARAKWTRTATKPNGHTTARTTSKPKRSRTARRRRSNATAHGDPEVIERPAPGSKTQNTKYKYDSHGEVESMTNPLERTWKYEYDCTGDKAEIDPEGNKRTWEYNEDSQETATVSPRGHVKGGEEAKFTTKTERDAQGRPLKDHRSPRSRNEIQIRRGRQRRNDDRPQQHTPRNTPTTRTTS